MEQQASYDLLHRNMQLPNAFLTLSEASSTMHLDNFHRAINTSTFSSFQRLKFENGLYEQARVDTEGNTPGSTKEPGIGWMSGFLFVSSFVGLLALVPLRKSKKFKNTSDTTHTGSFVLFVALVKRMAMSLGCEQSLIELFVESTCE
ncbi:hypothetical protein NC653_024346 [Populus alba x Populus x berolinensis]|uniref:Uncharacterized protein n=1 Tax=Populus alba x Populus x berolinensis TaxID=444605 RepID=A0AAD6M9I4_9ROSI|nr:hypothetical protein NC653_024346 [Populus alba x Populus x berolinensis]